ncbi:MAG: cyclic pyranopterin monophosphate synthase MoaC [Verrucomicrobiota bacterium JB022]|nr:cyclic pyranopterin monophosphate synthase MoaC [Verrucomicrobiota bacterium JB022]
MKQTFTHLTPEGQPQMVDVTAKEVSAREAVASAQVRLNPGAWQALADGDIQTKKGPVFHTAIIAGTQAVKRTADWIPFCHPLPIEGCRITITPAEAPILEIRCRVRTTYRTGVEMEALTGASAAALTIIDMCKAFGPDLEIRHVRLESKTGGASGDYQREAAS